MRDDAKEASLSKFKYANVDSEFNGKPVIGSFKRHENDTAKMGLFPTVLLDLFNKRKQIKAQLKPLVAKKEQMEKKNDITSQEYEDLCFDIQKIDSKQKAAKVFMNTFYGEAGNQLSPVYLLQLAAGVTQFGRYTIGFALKFVRGKGFVVVYGDTDSLYVVST